MQPPEPVGHGPPGCRGIRRRWRERLRTRPAATSGASSVPTAQRPSTILLMRTCARAVLHHA
eukprot:1707928-Pyramimonas_sp.AAC.1